MSAEPAPRISVIIPVFNGEPFLSEQLDALAAQDFAEPWELIICDNGSTDGTRALAMSRRGSFPVPLRILDASAERGVNFARNAGILAARAEKIAFCDADDRVFPTWLRAAFDGLDTHEVVQGPLHVMRTARDSNPPVLRHAIAERTAACGNLGIRRETLDRLGGFDVSCVRYGVADIEFASRMWKAGVKDALVPEFGIDYRLMESSWGFLRKIWSSCIAEVEVWRRHPEAYPDKQGRGYVGREALLFVPHLVTAARSGGLRRAVRVVITLAAHAVAMLPPAPELPAPRLLDSMPAVPEIGADEAGVDDERVAN